MLLPIWLPSAAPIMPLGTLLTAAAKGCGARFLLSRPQDKPTRAILVRYPQKSVTGLYCHPAMRMLLVYFLGLLRYLCMPSRVRCRRMVRAADNRLAAPAPIKTSPPM